MHIQAGGEDKTWVLLREENTRVLLMLHFMRTDFVMTSVWSGMKIYAISKILHNSSGVGFVYQKNEVEKVIIGAIEIMNNKIYQAKIFCNRKFEGSAKAYISGYAVRKRVNTSLCYDLRENESKY